MPRADQTERHFAFLEVCSELLACTLLWCDCAHGSNRICPAGHRHLGIGRRHHHHQRKAASATASEVRRRHQGNRQGFHAVVAAARGASQGRAQRAAHHDRRPGLWRAEHLRRRDSDAEPGSHRQGGAALHAVPLHGALLADAGGADHGPQPSLGRLRRHRRIVHRLPRL